MGDSVIIEKFLHRDGLTLDDRSKRVSRGWRACILGNPGRRESKNNKEQLETNRITQR